MIINSALNFYSAITEGVVFNVLLLLMQKDKISDVKVHFFSFSVITCALGEFMVLQNNI